MAEIIFDTDIVVAFDFDGTLTTFDDLYEEAPLDKRALSFVKKIKDLGVTTVLWTCRYGDNLTSCVDRLKQQGITFDYINEDNGKRNSGRKINVDIYIDDKANDGKIRWNKIYKKIKKLVRGQQND